MDTWTLPSDPRCFGPEHEAFRASVRSFVEREIAPFVADWDEAGSFPHELYAKAAAIGLLGIGYPEAYGGTPADVFMHLVAAEEISRAGSGGLQASLGSHGIALPPIVAHGLDDTDKIRLRRDVARVRTAITQKKGTQKRPTVGK